MRQMVQRDVELVNKAYAKATKLECDRIKTLLAMSVNEHCTCGGSGPDDPECCPACAVWHDMKAALREEVQ